MKTKLMKLLTKDRQARIFVLDNTRLIHEMLREQQLDPVSKEALSTAFTLSSLMVGLLKDDQRLSVRINMSERSQYIHCDVDFTGNVRGYASDALLAYTDQVGGLAELIGPKGFIKITKDIGMGAMFTGFVDMPYQNIVHDFSHYFLQSEQLETAFRYYYGDGPDTCYSRGILVQPLPFAEAGLLGRWTDWFDRKGHSFRTEDLYPTADLVEEKAIHLYCGCSKAMFFGLLLSLGQEELERIIEQQQAVEVGCSVCGKKYRYDHLDISSLLTG
ncbi:Hsp33 family molecular chaperone HslO [Paenibacillus sp. GCM10027626]|uniref:Hsp33 family molecular chaperone HslO n=1 Tax=Paenibacillus sp. GCM10027626 TaxID=3273411 RepID=UPI003643D8F7